MVESVSENDFESNKLISLEVKFSIIKNQMTNFDSTPGTFYIKNPIHQIYYNFRFISFCNKN